MTDPDPLTGLVDAITEGRRRLTEAEDDIRVLRLIARLRPWTPSQWVATAAAHRKARAHALVDLAAARLWPPGIPSQRAAPDVERTQPIRPRLGRRSDE